MPAATAGLSALTLRLRTLTPFTSLSIRVAGYRLPGAISKGNGLPNPAPSSSTTKGWASCGACGAYADDEAEEDANSTDAGSEWAEPSAELEAYLGSFEGSTPQTLREEYFLAKARFRIATGRYSSGTRFPRRAPWAHRRNGGKKGRKGGMGFGKGGF